MKKQKNVNMKIGNTMFRKVEQMDLDGLSKVKMAIYQEMRRIEASMSGNVGAATKALLHTQGKIAMKRMQQIDQYGRNLIKRAIPIVPASVTADPVPELVDG